MRLSHLLLQAALLLLAAVSAAEAAEPAIGDLIGQAAQLDGRIVRFEGEAIGDVMVRGRFAWVNVSDGSAAIGVWLQEEQARKIKLTGSYHGQGDLVRVEGRLNRACPQHGGDLDVHATRLAILERGKPTVHPLDPTKIATAAVLLPVGFLLLWATRRRARR